MRTEANGVVLDSLFPSGADHTEAAAFIFHVKFTSWRLMFTDHNGTNNITMVSAP